MSFTVHRLSSATESGGGRVAGWWCSAAVTECHVLRLVAPFVVSVHLLLAVQSAVQLLMIGSVSVAASRRL